MSSGVGVVAVALVVIVTLAVGSLGFRLSRTTSDFLVASRTVRPWANASAISGEYLSAASFLGVAGLVLLHGVDVLWYPIGWTAGYLVLLVLVAAPLRRSGAYTLPDFAEARLRSRGVRRVAAAFVVAIGWLYLLAQLQGARVTLAVILDAPGWVGSLIVALTATATVLAGGMRSITLVQAFQYWLKLTALLVPVAVLLVIWIGDGTPSPAAPGIGGVPGRQWLDPLATASAHPLYTTYSLVVATFLGTMGLPHVVVRFYTSPDGRAARRATVGVLALLGVFYVLPPVYGALARVYAPDLASASRGESVVLALPGRMVGGLAGDVLTGLVVAGAFAAFVATSAGLTVAVAGALGQELGRTRLAPRLGGVGAFRVGAVVAVLVPLTVTLVLPQLGVARAVALAFALSASTFCPLLVLGIWWRRLTDVGAVAGLAVGGLTCGVAVVDAFVAPDHGPWLSALLEQPAAWTVPLAFAAMTGASLLTPGRLSPAAGRYLVQLHLPEQVDLADVAAGDR